MFGRLSLSLLPHDPITICGVLLMIGTVAFVITLMFYFKKWTWFFENWLTAVDPKKIGIMYIAIAVIMLLRGISDAVMMRAQQATSVGSSHGVLSSNLFQQVFSAHGTIMIFFVGMGFMFGLINLVLPLQIGARDVAFPRLNSLSLWLFIAGAVLINLSLVIGEFSAAGWLAYPPLSETQFSPGVGVDYWIWSLQIAGIGSLLSGINFLVTILKMRAPGMSLMKMPMFIWSVFGSMTLVTFAFPILTVTLSLLFLDRAFGMHFFTAGGGGNAMMYVNLIWAWGHPEVYILVLPAFGVFSEVVATYSKKPLFGYRSMVWAIWSIVALSFIVWLHHFFTMGAGADVNAFFGIMTMLIAVPTGVKIFNWLFTMFRGQVKFASPMIWFLGFVFLFTMGGMAGVLMAVPPADFQLHNSLFLVAHFHTMIISGVLFGYFAGITYWFPKILGFKLNEKLGKYAAWLWGIGFVVAFAPLYVLGLMGATRRLDHYDPSTGWQGLFIVAGIGVAIICLGIFFQMLQLFVSIRNRNKNLDTTGDLWNGRTVEWSIPSPAPFYNFTKIPLITTRDQFWQHKKTKNLTENSYEDIVMPKNTKMGLVLGALSFLIGFAFIWHIWWMAVVALFLIIVSTINFGFEENLEHAIKAEDVKKLDQRTKDK